MLEVAKLRVLLAETEASAHDLAGKLAVQLGLPDLAIGDVGRLSALGLAGAPASLWREADDDHPAIEAARRNQLYARKRVDLARRERWPTPSISVGTVAIQNYYSISTYVGLTTPIPMFDWGQGSIAGAGAYNRKAAHETWSAAITAEAELHRVFNRLEHRRRALWTFETDVLATVPRMQRLIEDANREGRPELALDIRLTVFGVKFGHVAKIEALVRAELDVLAAAGRIEAAVGRDPGKAPDKPGRG